ncbi:MAG: energy transducer TonB [Alphaproteobacteria bacterium]|nr:MAG: energy transducer TonB [Alphaproteobacteria bacterium]
MKGVPPQPPERTSTDTDEEARPGAEADRVVAQRRPTTISAPERDDAATALPTAAHAETRPGGSKDGEEARSLPAHVGGGSSNPPPRYPYLARRRGQEGRVVLRVVVGADGRVHAIRVHRSSGYRLLDEAALDAVKRWHFTPARRGGVPVTGTLDVPISFRLTN